MLVYTQINETSSPIIQHVCVAYDPPQLSVGLVYLLVGYKIYRVRTEKIFLL